MTFKHNWEKTDQQVLLPLEAIQGMVLTGFPNRNCVFHEVISGGCANLNIKINLTNESKSFILRVYIRDKDAAFREQKLAALLGESIPIPRVYFVGDFDEYRFAITEYLPGITLRELLLGNQEYDIADIMHAVGALLVNIQAHQFLKSGFFDKDLNVAEPITQRGYCTFAKECLAHPTVIEKLGGRIISKINILLDKYHSYFPDEHQHHLVHADFDPANILVDKRNGKWVITGILDWEFAFSGSILCDVANMLRYSHQMPPIYEKAFLQGLKLGNVILPENWHVSINMLNILSLLDCLVRSDPTNRPNQYADICALIEHIINELNKVKIEKQPDFVRVKDVVHRASGPWSKQVHEFLHFLRENGFIQAPLPLGFDAQGRETVSFVPGQTSDYPLSEAAASINALISAARLLRAYHDVSQLYLMKNNLFSGDWMLPSKDPQEVICHGDFAPYNICFDKDQAIGLIDFDAAHPGPRCWDIVYALYRFSPFTNPDNEDGFGSIDDQIVRARLFCDAYGLVKEDRVGLADLMIERLQALLNFMMQSAEAGNEKYKLAIHDGHHLKYLADIEYIKLHSIHIDSAMSLN